MKAFIKGISYYLPEKVVTNEELVKEFPEWSVDKVAKKVGVDSRHIAAEDETAGDMAEKAARKLAESLSRRGVCIVSGMACGIEVGAAAAAVLPAGHLLRTWCREWQQKWTAFT